MDKYLIFLAGIPSSGKSYFGDWLEKNKDFVHVDLEKDRGERLGIFQLVENWLQTTNANLLVNKLRDINKNIVINWGFPTKYLASIESLKKNGFDVWWFSAERSIARKEFLKRGGIDIKCFEKQMNNIERDWQNILRVFNLNIIETLKKDGSRFTPDQLWEQMFQKKVWKSKSL